MKILSIRFELIKPGPRTFTCKATLVNEALQSVDAHGSGTSIEQAEEDATAKAISRGERMFGIRIVGFQQPAPEPPLKIPIAQEEPSQEAPSPTAPQPTATIAPAESAPEQVEEEVPVDTKMEPPAPTAPPEPSSQLKIPTHEERQAAALDRRASALDRLRTARYVGGICEEALVVAAKPHTIDSMPLALLESFVSQVEAGATQDDRQRAQKHIAALESAETLGELKTRWDEIHAKYWDRLSWQTRILLWDCKEQCKGDIPASSDSGRKEGCGSCKAPMKWIKTKNGKWHPLNLHSSPVLLSGEGPGEKKYVQNKGIWELVSTWPAIPGQAGSVAAYTSHYATCPDAEKYRRKNP